MFGLSFQIWGMFLNTAKDSMICTCLVHIFNNYLILQSVHSWHVVQRAKFYTQNWFLTCIINYEKYIAKEFCLCSHPHIVRACLPVPLCLNGCYIMVLEFGCCVPESGESNLVLFKNNFGKEFVLFYLPLRENGLSFKETSLRVGELGMTLGIYFNLSWALLSLLLKWWTWSGRNLRSPPTLTF